MTPAQFLATVIDPGLLELLEMGGPQVSDAARRMLVAIALVESGPNLNARYQNSPAARPGPARGWWQFEQIGVAGVLQHRSTQALARAVCERYSVVASDSAVWRAVEGHDRLACCFARLLLFSDPGALPGTPDAAYQYYLRTWRPGKRRPEDWPRFWTLAQTLVGD